jgi:phage/plasmid-like protein (TIGR03299 family)
MHEIDFTKGVPAIAYTGEKPWHGYGALLEEKQPLDVWLRQAGMDYEVEERPIFWNASAMELTPHHGDVISVIPRKKVLLRSDTLDVLSVVSESYKVVQPKEVLYFFESLIKDAGFKMNTAGVLAGGKRVWALAETGREFAVKGLDRLGAYLLLATSFDGQFSTTAQFTSIRVVCSNTLGFSLSKGENQETGVVRIPHSTEFDATEVKGELGLLGDSWTGFENNVLRLADFRVSKRQAVEFFLELLGVTEEEAVNGQQLQTVKKLVAFYESGPGSQFASSQNTTWGLVNAVSYFTDHGRRAHNNGNRFNSAAFGEGARLKKRAFDSALKLAA